jgi:hypothetical protein
VFFRQSADRGYLIVGAFDCLRAAAAKQLRLDPDRKELRVQAAGPGPNCVEMTIAKCLLEIDSLIQQPLRGVGVHVDCNRAVVD